MQETILEDGVLVETDGMKTIRLELMEFRRKRKELDEEIKNMEDFLKHKMLHAEVLISSDGEELITYKKSFRTSIDSAKLQQLSPALYDKVKVEREVRTFLIKGKDK